MARLTGPDESCRTVFMSAGPNKGMALAQGLSAPLYADAALTTPADVQSTLGVPIADSTVIVDAFSQVPLMLYPDGVDVIYTSINGGPVVALYARVDDRLDALTSAVSSGGAALATHAADTTNIHGIADTAALVAATDPRLADARTPTGHAASHAGGGTDELTLTLDQISGLVAALAAKAGLTGATFTGVVTVDDANFIVLGDGKGYRFRPLGARLDCEATGSDWQFSVFSGTAFDGTQRNYLRLESGVQLAHAIRRWIWADSPDGAAVHTLDGSAVTPSIGFFGATAQAQKTVTGSRGGNAALASLLTQLAGYGLIVDSTTA